MVLRTAVNIRISYMTYGAIRQTLFWSLVIFTRSRKANIHVCNTLFYGKLIVSYNCYVVLLGRLVNINISLILLQLQSSICLTIPLTRTVMSRSAELVLAFGLFLVKSLTFVIVTTTISQVIIHVYNRVKHQTYVLPN